MRRTFPLWLCLGLAACGPSVEERELSTEANCRAPFREVAATFADVKLKSVRSGRILYGGLQRGNYSTYQFKTASGLAGKALKIKSDAHLTTAYWVNSSTLTYYLVEVEFASTWHPKKAVVLALGHPVGVQENMAIRCPDEEDLRLSRLLEDMQQQESRLADGQDINLADQAR